MQEPTSLTSFNLEAFATAALGAQSPAALHDSLCALIVAQARVHPAWGSLAAVLLAPDVVATAKARLASLAREPPPPAPAGGRTVTCSHCGSTTPEISVSIASMDGTTVTVDVPERARICEVKRAMAQSPACEIDPDSVDLYTAGKEHALLAAQRLDSAAAWGHSKDPRVLFALPRQVVNPRWCWTASGPDITVGGDGGDGGLVAWKHGGRSYQLATGGEPMTVGRHYWEVAITESDPACLVRIGAARVGLDHGRSHCTLDAADASRAFYVFGKCGNLWGDGLCGASMQGPFKAGDRIGVLLDLDAGWMRFYRNGERCGPGFTEGVTGPLLRAVELCAEGTVVTVVPDAAAPGVAEAAAKAGQERSGERGGEERGGGGAAGASAVSAGAAAVAVAAAGEREGGAGAGGEDFRPSSRGAVFRGEHLREDY